MRISTQVVTQKADLLFTALLAGTLVVLNLIFVGNVGINLADEGFLWYGVIHTAQGQVPLRDFQSYDPGRYYWTVAWSSLFGTGILGVRYALVVFQGFGLWLGILAARKVIPDRWFLSLVAVLLIVWMFPRHKLFEHSVTMAAVYVGACLLESPSLWRHFLAGGFVGSAAFIGVNHGLYTGVAFSCLLLFIQYRTSSCESLWKCVSVWGVGILCGYVPMLFMFFSCPGFAGRYLDLLLSIWRRGTTNLPLPVPWPWQIDYLAVDWLTGVTAFVVGLAFCILPLFYGTALVLLLWRRGDVRRQSVFIASTFVGLVYMQYAFSRADLSHLAQSIHPLLLGLVALPTMCEPTRSRRTALGIILVALGLSLFPAYRGSPLFSTCIWRGQGCVLYVINGEELWLAESEKIGLERLRTVMTQHVIDTEGIFIAPHAPGLYCVLQKDSPVWQTYFIFPEQAENEEVMIEALRTKKIRWALVGDVALDGREELRFRHTHTLVWQYVRQEFEPVEVEGLPLHYQLFRRKAF